ncbi:MAG: hypothetical protein M0C28_25820 [Candidatus Moduliflexus flocculans]|nr:hypothetical protein [Candidatus Moduliflexus flocculans]
MEGEVRYTFGNAAKMDSGPGDVSISGLAAYINAVATFGPVYVEAVLRCFTLSGDDPANDGQSGEGGAGKCLFPADRTGIPC